MGNVTIKECGSSTIYTHWKGAVDELSFDKKPTGEVFFLKDVWILRKDPEGGANLYLRKCGSETLETHFIVKPSHSMMIELIQSGSVHKDMTNHHRIEKQLVQIKWSVEFDGKPLMELLKYKHKMSYKDVLNVIENEGGSVDVSGIIHRPVKK